MKPISLAGVITLILSFFLSALANAQSFGISSSAVWITDCNQSNYYNTSGGSANLIGPVGNTFANKNFGVHTQYSGTLVLRGGQLRTFKNVGVANVCSARMYFRTYPVTGTPGSFDVINLPFTDDCNISPGQFPSGGTCVAGDQKWNRVTADGEAIPYAPVDLTWLTTGDYILEVYYEVSGSNTSTSLCDETVVLNNGGNNFKAFFSLQLPSLVSTNPTTCNGTNGAIIITGLVPGATYGVTYTDDGVSNGPVNFLANSSGQIIISGLNAGVYADFELAINGCTTELNTGLILSNPVFTPRFNKINPFCAGSTPPALPATSNNGITGTWSPSVIDNQNSGTYTFTPTPGQCGIPATINVVVNPNITPTFSFGNSLTICAGASVPLLPTTSLNGFSGSWSPATIDNQNSGSYTFTPTAGQCATATTFSVTVTLNITPTFSFGNSLTLCAGGVVPTLPSTSTNGITGSWNPAIVDDQNSATYTFTPNAGPCAVLTTFTVTVNPNVAPMFDFGSSLAICAGGSVPVLPSTSANNITGTWSPAVISNQNSASYTFTPSGGQCATTTTFTVNVNSNTTPLFGFSSSLTICAGASVPLLPTTSNNSITGTWGPSTVSNQASGTYIFTPAGGQCATTSTFSVTVNPNITPTFSFGTTLTICANGTVPLLTNTSTNGINGTWSPATIDNENSAVYTFTPNSGECATTTTFSVTVNPIITPDFSFGTSLDICAGSAVPLLPATSSNGITGTWSASVVSNQNSASYIFTPTSGQCATEAIFSVTVTPNIIPTFSFGTTLNICAGGNVPELPNTSENNITGTWSPAVIDNSVSAVYVFTPVTTPGQCISSVNFTVTVNPILIPTFNFGTTQTICAGSTVPLLPLVSTNGVTGTWSPAVVSNQNSGTYIFTTDAGQCALPDASFTMTVNALPTIDVRTNITINDGTTVPLYTPSGTPAGLSFSWTNSNPAIGLAASGTGSVPSFIATNKGSASITATITVTPILNGCSGLPRSYTITVIPLYKDVFVPNVFSPNGDGKNDILIVYGNYIEKLDMRIFNQWGEQVEKIDNKTRGWDGRHKGKAQPVGVYVYALEAVLTDGRTVKMKGYITLLR